MQENRNFRKNEGSYTEIYQAIQDILFIQNQKGQQIVDIPSNTRVYGLFLSMFLANNMQFNADMLYRPKTKEERDELIANQMQNNVQVVTQIPLSILSKEGNVIANFAIEKKSEFFTINIPNDFIYFEALSNLIVKNIVQRYNKEEEAKKKVKEEEAKKEVN